MTRPGRRATALAVVGIILAGQGLSLLHDAGQEATDEALLYLLVPLWVRVCLWVATGLAAITLALLPERRTEPAGWAVATIMPVTRVASHAWSLTMWAVPGGQPGTPHAASYLLVWAATVALLWWLAKWPEPGQTPPDHTSDQL